MIRKLITTLRRTGAFIALASALVGASAAAASADPASTADLIDRLNARMAIEAR